MVRMKNVKVNGEELEQLLLAETALGEGTTDETSTADVLKHSAIMKLTSSGVGCKYEFLSAKAEELHANTLRDKVSLIRFGELSHRIFEPLVRHDLSMSTTTPLQLIAIEEGKVGKAFRLGKSAVPSKPRSGLRNAGRRRCSCWYIVDHANRVCSA